MKKIALSFFVVAASAGYVWSQWSGPGSLALLPPRGDNQVGKLAQSATVAPAAPPIQPVPFITGETVTVPADQPAPLPPAAAEAPAAPSRPPAAAQAPAEPPLLPKPAAPTRMAAVAPAAKPPEPAPATPPADAGRPPRASQQMAQAAPINPPLPHPAPTSDKRTAHPAPTFDKRTAAALLSEANPAPVRHGAFADGTYTGPVINVFYGLVQIQAVVHNGRLASINVLHYPSDRRVSVRINRQALPMLRNEVVSAQSARVNIISGATLTSVGFLRSLDAALQQAKA